MSDDAVDLLDALVRIPSISGDEAAVAAALADWLSEHGVAVEVLDGRNVVARLTGDEPGPALLLNSHLDVVPPGDGWSGDPFLPRRDGDRLTARGANDAKGCVAAMAVALAALSAERPLRGSVTFAATAEEERGHSGLEKWLPTLGAFAGALVGEPTGLRPAVAQNGLVILELKAIGKQGHAARPRLAVNAIDVAARDVVALHDLRWMPENPHVGPMTLAVTQAQAGMAHNVIPGEARLVVDIRTIPEIPPEQVVARVREVVRSEVTVRSMRFSPVATPEGARILAAVRATLPDAEPFGSPTLSDWVHLKGVPAVKIGPGLSEISHTADEWVSLDSVRAGAVAYERIARRFLA